ncbi:hypothetical protein LP417_01690 [Polaromonas sp. P1-6]|nr:hypothetical protein LP417_01690 [Polaromonas sp. P1-6]
MSRTGTLGRLFGHVAEPAIQMNAQDMARRLLKEGDLVHVTSKRGSIVVPVQASSEIGMSQAFIAMHWGEEYLSGVSSTGERLAGVNAITTSAYCPSSKQPELKHAAVKILKAELPWSLLAMAWLPDSDALGARTRLKSLMAGFAFTSCVPFSNNRPLTEQDRERTGVLFRAAGYEAPSDEVLADIEGILGLAGSDALRYADKRKASTAPCGWSVKAIRPSWPVLCSPAIPAPRPGSKPCCRTNSRRRPMAGCCCCPAPNRRWRCSRVASWCAPA